MKIAWITPWEKVCGIADYSKALWPFMQAAAANAGMSLECIPLESPQAVRAAAEFDLIHYQHEYGLFGGKNPPFYRFPSMVVDLRSRRGAIKQVATAHTVLSPEYSFPVRGRGWQAPIRALANRVLLPALRQAWGPRTWGPLDGVVVHSEEQRPLIQAAGASAIRVIPHFVPKLEKAHSPRVGGRKTIVVFGFFTPEKGQDVVIRAMEWLPADMQLVLAGGVRRKKDQVFLDACKRIAEELGVLDRVRFTGYVPAKEVSAHYAAADLVVAPFRETSGSGSLAQAFARGAPILASDLPLNLDIERRERGCLAFFRSEDPKDCAERITRLLDSQEKLAELRKASEAYAAACAPDRIAEQHFSFYRELLK